MTPFLDRHLIFPILNFLRETKMYNEDDIGVVELRLLSETNMIDYAMDQYGEKAENLSKRREEVIEEITSKQKAILPLLEILEDEERVKRISTFKSMEELCQDFHLEQDTIEGLAAYAKMQFDCGNYSMCGELLKHYRSMIQQDAGGAQGSKHVSCIWGALAACLLNKEFDNAAEVIFKLDEFLENTKTSKREVLLQRTWLLHWALFAIFTGEKVETKLLDFFLNEKSLSIISLSCPHLFRYVGACLILHKRVKHLVKDTVWIIQHESSSYSDPVTRLLLALYTDMDFDEAQRMLQQCEVVCRGDYFLAQRWAELEENARLLIFETYCRIHQCINIEMIATKLNMGAEEAELWIVKLIQNAKLDARIDSEKHRVVMSKAPPSVYQQVIEKTKNMSFRSTMLLSNLEKRGLAVA
jgi:translation initiation factor 3 subunit E